MCDNSSVLMSVRNNSDANGEHHSYGSHVTVGVILAVAMIGGLITNIAVMWSFSRPSKRSRPAFHWFIINLAVTDVLTSAGTYPLVVISSFYGTWMFGDAGCYYYAICVGTCGLASIATMAFVAVDRYSVISSNLACPGWFTPRRTLLAILSTWLFGFLWTSPPLIGFGKYTLDGFGTSCSFDYFGEDMWTRMFVLSMFLGGFFVPLVVIIVCYILIFCTVYQHEKMLRVQTASSSSSSNFRIGNQNFKSELKVARVSAIVVSLFCLAWIPYAVVSLIGVAGYSHLITPLASLVPALFAKVSVVYNPLVYAVSMRRFQHRMAACFKCCACWKRSMSSIEVTHTECKVSSSSSKDTRAHRLAKVLYIPRREGKGRNGLKQFERLAVTETEA